LSGGCLEANLLRYARQVWSNQTSIIKAFDFSSEDNDWESSLGCGGIITVLIQAIDKQNDYLDLDKLMHHMQAREAVQYCLSLAPKQSRNMAKLMEWQVHVMEARSHFAKQHQFIGVDSIIRGPFEEKSPQLFEHIDAIVCMSHHVGYDAKALLWALQTSSPYIGLLGPAHRTDKVLQAANIEREHFGDKLHNPVGLNIGGDTPEAIALSILAEIQASISAKRSSAIPSS
jgi:xanthine/CO dehydrogenase XdhC/CoxF family maturation factor